MTSRWAVALCILFGAGCTGGQTGQPTDFQGEGKCKREPWGPDEPTPFSAAPRALLGGFVGAYRAPVVWFPSLAPQDCPRNESGTSEIEIVLRETGNAEISRCDSGASPERDSISLGVSAELRSSDGVVDQTIDTWLNSDAQGRHAALHDPFSLAPLHAWFVQEHDRRAIAGNIAIGETSGGFPSSCPAVCAAEPMLDALRLPIPVARVLQAFQGSTFTASMDGKRVDLGFESPLLSGRACLLPADAGPEAKQATYSLPSRVNLAGGDALQVPGYTSVRLTSGGECADCVEITTETEGLLAPTSGIWPQGATDVHVYAKVQLRVGPSGPLAGSGSLQVSASGEQSIAQDRSYALVLAARE